MNEYRKKNYWKQSNYNRCIQGKELTKRILPITCSSVKRGKMFASKSRLTVVLLPIGLESGTSLPTNYRPGKQNQSFKLEIPPCQLLCFWQTGQKPPCQFMNNAGKWITNIIIFQTHNEKSDWSRAFNQFTIACELDMINVISAADITFNVCLVTKPLRVFSSETKWLNASLLFLRMNYVKNV